MTGLAPADARGLTLGELTAWAEAMREETRAARRRSRRA